MTDAERRRIGGLENTVTYADDNAADFPAGTIQQKEIDKIRTELKQTDQHSVNQAVGEGGAGAAYETKDTARENLREHMAPIPEAARVMEYAIDGISERFRMPRNRTDQDMLTTARAWVTELVPFDADFQAYGLD